MTAPKILVTKSFISVALYRVNSWLISIINDNPKAKYITFAGLLSERLSIGSKTPKGTKQKIFSINSAPIPLSKGIKLIFGLKKGSPKRDNLKNSFSVGIPTTLLNNRHI